MHRPVRVVGAPASRVVGALVCALLALGAGTTTVDDAGDDTDVTTTVAAPTAAFSGSPAELLADLSVEMSRLGSQVADGSGDDATLERIEAIWAGVRDAVESERPELVDGIDTTVAMARTAVERTRPADADKAFSLLTDLVDVFTGDR